MCLRGQLNEERRAAIWRGNRCAAWTLHHVSTCHLIPCTPVTNLCVSTSLFLGNKRCSCQPAKGVAMLCIRLLNSPSTGCDGSTRHPDMRLVHSPSDGPLGHGLLVCRRPSSFPCLEPHSDLVVRPQHARHLARLMVDSAPCPDVYLLKGLESAPAACHTQRSGASNRAYEGRQQATARSNLVHARCAPAEPAPAPARSTRRICTWLAFWGDGSAMCLAPAQQSQG